MLWRPPLSAAVRLRVPRVYGAFDPLALPVSEAQWHEPHAYLWDFDYFMTLIGLTAFIFRVYVLVIGLKTTKSSMGPDVVFLGVV